MSYGEKVEGLLRQGTQSLGEKQYEKAVQVIGEACEAYQEETGETDPYLMFLYGKSLYESGVSKSDVLGGQEITNDTIESSNTHVEEQKDGAFQFNDLAAEGEEEESEEEPEPEPEQEQDEEEEGGEEEGEGEEKTDMELAWDMLEVSRQLYEDELKNHKSDHLEIPYLKSDKEEPSDEYVKTLKHLSEVHDLLGEVSLESEHFIQAAQDLETCLNMRKQLYEAEYSSLVGESHFKLSLALEFCIEDDTAKSRARQHIKDAISILHNDSTRNPDKKEDNDEMVASLQERYDEIENSAEEAINQQKEAMMQGIFGGGAAETLGQVLGGIGSGSSGANSTGGSLTSASSTAAKPVNDLSGMVKKRKPKSGGNEQKRQKK